MSQLDEDTLDYHELTAIDTHTGSKIKSGRRQNWFKTLKRLGLIVTIVAGILTASLASIQIYRTLNQPGSPYSYSSPVPGPGCDPHHAQWVLAHGVEACLPSSRHPERYQLSTILNEGIAQIYFYGTQQLPNNYQVNVDIDKLSAGACAGIITRNKDSRKGGYAFEICDSGVWLIARYDAVPDGESESISNLARGQFQQQTAYSISATSDGVSLRFKVGTNSEVAASDGNYSDTDSVSLFVTPTSTGVGSATFQNFAFNEIRH